jgi:hypothetical protein
MIILCFGNNRNNALTVTLAAELDKAVRESKERIVSANADVQARVRSGATLTDKNISGDNCFAAEFFYAQALSIRVAPVFSRAGAFFVSHDTIFLSGDISKLNGFTLRQCCRFEFA